jgi:hypothetical protein
MVVILFLNKKMRFQIIIAIVFIFQQVNPAQVFLGARHIVSQNLAKCKPSPPLSGAER